MKKLRVCKSWGQSLVARDLTADIVFKLLTAVLGWGQAEAQAEDNREMHAILVMVTRLLSAERVVCRSWLHTTTKPQTRYFHPL